MICNEGGASLATHLYDALCISAGLSVTWKLKPPKQFEQDREFNVSYYVDATDDFFQWAVDQHYFSETFK